jgi:hypothetical protein
VRDLSAMPAGNKATIASASASLANETATVRVLGNLPHAAEIRAKLATPLLAQHWDKATQRSFWLMSDGVGVRCLTVTGLNAKEVAAIGARVQTHTNRSVFDLSPQAMREIIVAEIDVAVEFVL